MTTLQTNILYADKFLANAGQQAANLGALSISHNLQFSIANSLLAIAKTLDSRLEVDE